MNSLVVFLSVMALAASKPSVPLAGLLSVSGVAIAPAAVSHQSRVDIKSSPAIISEVVAPIGRTVVAQPALVAPTSYAPLAYSAPLTYPAVAIAPAAISSQSTLDIKSSPAIAIAGAPLFRSPLAPTPLIYPLTYSAALSPLAIARSDVIAAPSAIQAEIPAAQPLPVTETPEVAAARAAHLEAKAEIEASRQIEESRQTEETQQIEESQQAEESHQIQKRSVRLTVPQPLITPYVAPIAKISASPLWVPGAHIPLPAPVLHYY